MGCCGKCSKGLIWCCGITAILLIIVIVVLIILIFTIFKPKDPKIITQPITIENFNLIYFPAILLNVTLGVVLTIDNQNYGSFKYKNGTAYISYHGNLVAEAPVEDGKIPARGKQNVSTSVTIFADKLISDSKFLIDFASGVLNFNSTTTLHGKVRFLKYFHKKATTYSSCDISIFTPSFSVNSTCTSKVEL